MEHSEATEKMIAEGYVLGQLLPEERDAFEEHFFQCAECAEDVRDAATVHDSMQVVLHDAPKVIAFPSRWANWLATAASVAAIAAGSMFGYVQYVTVPYLQAGYGVIRQSATVDFHTNRSFEKKSFAADKAFQLAVGIPVKLKAPSYRVEIREGRRVVRSFAVSAEEAKNYVSITDPGLPAGEYELALYSAPDQGEPIATQSLLFR